MCRAGGDAISAGEFLHRGKNVPRTEHTALDRSAEVIRNLQIWRVGRLSRHVTLRIRFRKASRRRLEAVLASDR